MYQVYISSGLYAYDDRDDPQAIRAKLREVDLGWEEMNNIYLHERNKRRSKLSAEEVFTLKQFANE